MAREIAERIKKADKPLGVTRHELMAEVIELYQNNDIGGMQDLFEAYRDWELRGTGKNKETKTETVSRAQKNLDCVCAVADTYVKIHDEVAVMALIGNFGTESLEDGPVRKFYRASIGYCPLEADSSPAA